MQQRRYRTRRIDTILTVLTLILLAAAYLVPKGTFGEPRHHDNGRHNVQRKQPYGSCDEAWRYPSTIGYEDCRRLGLVP